MKGAVAAAVFMEGTVAECARGSKDALGNARNLRPIDFRKHHAERACSTVTKRIKQALQKIAWAIPALGHHLTARIKTGYFCSYNPHPDRLVA